MNHELNAEVAEKVMHMVIPMSAEAREIWPPIPDFSGSIAAAWTVVEKMRWSHDFFILCQYDTGDWTAEFSKEFQEEIFYRSAPEAICRAALAAVKIPA